MFVDVLMMCELTEGRGEWDIIIDLASIALRPFPKVRGVSLLLCGNYWRTALNATDSIILCTSHWSVIH